MTILSFAMLGRFAGINMRQLKPSDLDPVKVYVAAEDKVQRTWARTVKYYENLRVVFEIQTQLKEWADQQPARSRAKCRRNEHGRQNCRLLPRVRKGAGCNERPRRARNDLLRGAFTSDPFRDISSLPRTRSGGALCRRAGPRR